MAWYLLLLCIVAELLILTRGQPGNSPPTWVTSSYSSLTRGVSEDTPVGAFLTQLRCTDPENDPIVYTLQTGKAVRVFTNGTVVLAVKLDFEQKDTLGYDLTFTCADIYPDTGLNRHVPVQTNVQISVNDANDNPPVFQVDNLQGYSFSVREDALVGTIVEASIQTVDRDRTVNAVLRTMYLICNSTNATELANLPDTSIAMCEKFKLTYTQVAEGVYNATVTLVAPLDYEDRPVYSSKIVAIDGPGLNVSFTSTVNIQINVIDTQDMPPVFTNPGEATSVSEGAPIGSTVMDLAISARDGDTGDKRAIALSIINDPKNAFNLTVPVEATPGEGIYFSRLIVRNQLDRETNLGAYVFIVQATEIDKNTSLLVTDATATATYSVFVSDINDNPPLFAQSLYVVNMTEIDSNNTSTMQVTGLHIVCSDRDEPANAQYTITIVRQTIGLDANAINVTDAYSISPDLPIFIGNASLFLQVNNPKYLDYDIPQYRVHTIVLVARENGTAEKFSSSTTVSIFLLDINDNSPQFDQPFYHLNISENSTFPKELIKITAHDKDSGRNGQVTYRLEGGVSGKFSIDSVTGNLSLIAALDYETVSEYVFLVYATDQALEARSSQVQVTVSVINFNDVSPRFRQSQYQTSVNESSLVFLNPLTVTAVDDEVGTVQITYRIVSGQSTNNAFVLNPTTGELTLRAFLDFADTPKNANGNNTGVYVLVVEASDNGSPPLTSTVNVTITVIDENNHPPELNPTVYYDTLSEIAKEGTSVVQINGTDKDAGDNGKITYRLGEGSTDNFAVVESTGLIIVGPAKFDYDVQNRYTLIIIATDGGAPQKSATATVFVNITDSNNKDPFFSEFLYLINVDDRTAVNTVIQTVAATDADSTASLEYNIIYNSIVATDPTGSSYVSVTPFDYRESFGVNQNGGIYIKNKLNHNIVAETTFKLMVRDVNTEEGTGTGTTQITIIIRGEVYQNITFDAVNQVYMNEDAQVNYSPITVTARDPNNQPVTEYIKVNGSEYFDVDYASGQIKLNKLVDYETDRTPNHLHLVIVRATKDQQSATVTVTISIVDVNDNNPVFHPANYTAQVSETAVYPTMVVSISATDADSPSYGPLGFDLSGLDSDDFQIFMDPVPAGQQTSRRGQVIVAQGRTLDYNRRNQYDLTIIVGDNLNRIASSIRNYNVAPLTIFVIDENNHSPVFKEERRSLAIPETAELGRSITTLVATDADKGRNGEIVYSLEATTADASSAEGLQLFSVGQQSGIVSVAQSLIGFGNRVFHLQVRARDRGDIPNSNIMMLDITVLSTEDNDGNPKWIYPPNAYVLYAPEETPGYLLRDNDNSSRFFNVIPRTGTEVIYALSPYSDKASSFYVNSTTGEITIIGSLDREVQDTYNILIYAEDTNDTAKYRAGLQLVVKLLDVNDNDATFTNPRNYSACQKTDQPLRITVKENLGINVTVATLKACDPDSGVNAAITYLPYNKTTYCDQNNNASPLWADASGQLITRRNIDYEQDKEFIMCVQALSVIPASIRKKRAFDMSQIVPNVNNVAYIYIVVQDENDNGPKFPFGEAFGIVQADPGTGPVLTLNAQDVDGDRNNIILYRIDTSVFYPLGAPPSPFSGAFSIREGAIYPLLSSYQQYSGGYFVLKVIATDRLNNSLTDSQTVTIYVYEKGQAVKIILDLKPEIGAQYAQSIISELGGVSKTYQFVFLRSSEHITDKAVDMSKSDICFLAIDTNSQNILNIRNVIELLSQDKYQKILNKVEYHVIEEGQCYPSPSSESNIKWRDLWWVLVAVAIFLFVCSVILIVLISILYDRYKRFMETRKTYMVTQ